jgi:hypothetical protein
MKNDILVTDKLAELHQEGALSDAEYAHLSKLAQVIEADLAGQDLASDKEASAFRDTLNNIGRSAKENPIQAATLATMGLGVAAPLIGKGVRAITDPIRENMRYKRMMALPGPKPVIADDQLPNYYVEGDDAQEKALRKAFSIMHRYGPEITEIPELARSRMHQLGAQRPIDIATRATGDVDAMRRGDMQAHTMRRDKSMAFDRGMERLKYVGEGLHGMANPDAEANKVRREAEIREQTRQQYAPGAWEIESDAYSRELGVQRARSRFPKTASVKEASSEIPVMGGGASFHGRRIPDIHGVSEMQGQHKPFVPFDQGQQEAIQQKHNELYQQQNQSEEAPPIDFGNFEQSVDQSLGGSTALELFQFVRQISEENGALKERVQGQEQGAMEAPGEDPAAVAAQAKLEMAMENAQNAQAQVDAAQQEVAATQGGALPTMDSQGLPQGPEAEMAAGPGQPVPGPEGQAGAEEQEPMPGPDGAQAQGPIPAPGQGQELPPEVAQQMEAEGITPEMFQQAQADQAEEDQGQEAPEQEGQEGQPMPPQKKAPKAPGQEDAEEDDDDGEEKKASYQDILDKYEHPVMKAQARGDVKELDHIHRSIKADFNTYTSSRKVGGGIKGAIIGGVGLGVPTLGTLLIPGAALGGFIGYQSRKEKGLFAEADLNARMHEARQQALSKKKKKK